MNLQLLESLEFPRYVMDSSVPACLVLFCDASQKAYGFAAYIVQKSSSCLVFSKETRILPTLELLSVYLAFRCLPNLLKSYSHIDISDVLIAVDAQIVLSLVLSDTLTRKNQFVKNRLRNIRQSIEATGERHNLEIRFKYVNTPENPADLITQGVFLERLKAQFELWISGPPWLTGDRINWPASELNCFSVDKGLFHQTQFHKLDLLLKRKVF